MKRAAATASGRTYGTVIANIQGVLWLLDDGCSRVAPPANNALIPPIRVSEYQIDNLSVADIEEKMAQQVAKPATCWEKGRGEHNPP
jgi:hypothetical protein